MRDQIEVWQLEVDRDLGVLRFVDPNGRHDESGRPIFHDFVIFEPEGEMRSIEDARARVWSEVGQTYRIIWDKPLPPAAAVMS